MSNVVKMAAKKKKSDINAWQAKIEKNGDKLLERIYDAITLADHEADYEDIPEEFADCSTIAALVSVLVEVTYKRNVLSPEALLKLVKMQTEKPFR